MEKKMEAVEVRTKDGQVWIVQDVNGEDNGIVINPEQVPALVKWLNEAAAELLSRSA
jgi:hypothetical protein